ncbi:hypothetical protein A3715_05210 [Oleiphilus sp. HI0009]|nr:TlpA disulfide reductase family protein [Oleiphilus sp. HI0067]KZX76467.1 hypothetical protein A3715_21870 [Oleiphilus sp. HI0009]KZY65319.1 hypothetical protein A3738_01080 [Oleiphilus sp. HI0066]KZZ58378.1 hypothetical protein A3762_18400 [Oleiphilus sp. HI0125]KZX83165.1 hypothetical protein A3715_05210 [Oleiphilus sp. HI0009]KZY68461.1 hypothetical protein A3739_01425 [Oleiphilus sp. HI0067]
MRMQHLIFILLLLISSISRADFVAAPDFHLKELANDTMHRLSDYRGTVIYLDFWASWCGPCRQSLPALDRLQKEFSPDDFQVIAINLDEDSAEALGFLADYPVDYTVLTEKTGKTQRAYHLVGLPSSFLIDQRGEVIGSFQGFKPDHIPKVKRAVNYLLEE